MQLDAEDDDQPFYKPPVGIAAAPDSEPVQRPPDSETQAQAAATTTAEQDD